MLSNGGKCDTLLGFARSYNYNPPSPTSLVIFTFHAIPHFSLFLKQKQEGTKQTVTDLVSRYPTLTSKISLPYPTSEKGELLYALVITNKNFNPSTKNPNYGGKGKLLVVSGIHARELTTGETSK